MNIEHRTSNTEHRMDAGGDVSRLLQIVSRTGSSFLILLVRIYQLTMSPAKMFLFGPTAECRFQPSCSQYAIEALKTHGAVTGGWLAAKRVCRCHPWGECGEDAVPPRKSKVQGLEHFQKYCSHTEGREEKAVFLGFGFVSAQSQAAAGMLLSPKPRQNPKILAPYGYSISSNALTSKGPQPEFRVSSIGFRI